MSAPAYIKFDGVDLNVEWVKAMKRDEFIADAQVNRLFHRIPGSSRQAALSAIYETITGRKVRKAAPVTDAPAAALDDVKPVLDQN